MHEEALGGGVAGFEAAVEGKKCPYLNQLGETALGEVRAVYEQVEAGNYEALGQLAERLATAAEQKAAERKEESSQEQHAAEAKAETGPEQRAEPEDTLLSAVVVEEPAAQEQTNDQNVQAAAESHAVSAAAATAASAPAPVSAPISTPTSTPPSISLPHPAAPSVEALRKQVDQVFAKRSVDAEPEAETEVSAEALTPEPVVRKPIEREVDEVHIEAAIVRPEAVETAVEAEPEEESIADISWEAADQDHAEAAARLKILQAHEAAELAQSEQPEIVETEVLLPEFGLLATNEAELAAARRSAEAEAMDNAVLGVLLPEAEDAEPVDTGLRDILLPELPIFDFRVASEALTSAGSEPIVDELPDVIVPDFVPAELYDEVMAQETSDGIEDAPPLETYERFIEALQLLIATSEPLKRDESDRAADPFDFPSAGEREAVEIPLEAGAEPVPAIAVMVAERLEGLDVEKREVIAPLLREIAVTMQMLEVLRAEAFEMPEQLSLTELSQPDGSFDNELMETIMEQLDGQMTALFEQLGIEYTEEDILQLRAMLLRPDFQIVPAEAAAADTADLEHDGTHEAKRHFVQLVSDGLADVEHKAERLLGKLVLLHSPGSGWRQPAAA